MQYKILKFNCVNSTHVQSYIDRFLHTFLLLYVEMLEALSSSSSMPIMTTIFTNTNTTVSQQSTGSTTVHHTSCVSSVKATTTSVSSITQPPQGMLTCSVCIVSVAEYRLTNSP